MRLDDIRRWHDSYMKVSNRPYAKYWVASDKFEVINANGETVASGLTSADCDVLINAPADIEVLLTIADGALDEAQAAFMEVMDAFGEDAG